MPVHSRPSMKYQDGMELSDRKMKKDCTQPLRIGNIRALNGCAGRLFAAATLHNHKNSTTNNRQKRTIIKLFALEWPAMNYWRAQNSFFVFSQPHIQFLKWYKTQKNWSNSFKSPYRIFNCSLEN